ncbi:hypothetical protein JXQ31_07305 [candidate division KSB1 bacterium]|nr:hypothetical protein [candidate division KSB1 bacterium]
MNTKLTLKLDKATIQKAKIFAKENKVSLSSLVENYFESLIKKVDKTELTLPPSVRALSGVLKLKNFSETDQIRDDYLMEKYLRD